MTPTTLPAALTERARHEPERPFTTYYDLASGERVELSFTSWANWVAKTAHLLTEELDLERGDVLAVDLPCHWQATVVIAAAWAVGVEVCGDLYRPAAGVIAVSETALDLLPPGEPRPTLALSLRPMNAALVRSVAERPGVVVDYAETVLAHPDDFWAADPPTADDVAWSGPDGGLAQRDVVGHPTGDRVLTDVAPSSTDGAALLGAALAGRGSLVLISGLQPVDGLPDTVDRLVGVERADRVVRSPSPPPPGGQPARS